MNSYKIILLSLVLALSQSACMKTRSQIKEQSTENTNEAEEATPVTVKRYEMDEIKSEMTRLSGKLEEIEHLQRSNNVTEVKEYTSRLDGRIAELEKNQLLIMAELKGLKDKKAADDTAARIAATPSKDLLAQANQLLGEKKYDDAAEKLKLIIDKNQKGKEAAEAFFGLGEIEFIQKNYKKAIVHYSKVQEAFTNSNRAAASLYKIGSSFQHLSMPKEAKGFFAELVERFPKSTEAKKARAKSNPVND